MSDYQTFTQQLLQQGYSRVELDDRLLDILSGNTLAKGVELWEKWEAKTIHFIRLHLPFHPKKAEKFSHSRKKIENLLLKY